MTLWLYPDPPPASVADWISLRDAVNQGLRRPQGDNDRWTTPVWVFTGMSVLSAVLYMLPLLKKSRPGTARWRCWERDDRGFFHPVIQSIQPIIACLYAITSCIAAWFLQDSLRDGRVFGKVVITEALACLVLFIFALTKAIALIYTIPQTDLSARRAGDVQILRLRIPPAVFNFGIVFSMVGLSLGILACFGVVSAFVDYSRYHHDDFGNTVELIVAAGTTTGDTNSASLATLQAQALSQLHACLRYNYVGWLIFRYTISIGALLFTAFMALYGTSGYVILSALYRHVSVYRRAVRNLRELQQLQTVEPASEEVLRTRQNQALNEVATPHDDWWRRRLHATWFERSTEGPEHQVAGSEKRSPEGELRGRMTETERQYRFLLRYGLVMAANILSVGLSCCTFVACYIYVAINPGNVPVNQRLIDLLLIVILWLQAAWSATFAVPLGFAACWLAFAHRPSPPATPRGVRTSVDEVRTRVGQPPESVAMTDLSDKPVPLTRPPPASLGRRLQTILRPTRSMRRDSRRDTVLSISLSGRPSEQWAQPRPSATDSRKVDLAARSDSAGEGPEGSSQVSQEPAPLSHFETIKALRQKSEGAKAE